MENFLEDLDLKVAEYWNKWNEFRLKYKLSDFIPTTVGYKVADINNFNDILNQLLVDGSASQLHIGSVNKRYIASVVLTKPLFNKIQILKLMQRRPDSEDPVGLDHLDFYVENLTDTEKEFKSLNLSGWNWESNDAHKWISLRFYGLEAKFVDHLVLDVGVSEMNQASKKLGYKPKMIKF